MHASQNRRCFGSTKYRNYVFYLVISIPSAFLIAPRCALANSASEHRNAQTTGHSAGPPPSSALRANSSSSNTIETVPVAKSDADPAQDPSRALEEVIVTAQQYRQSALSVPISLTVLQESTLQQEHLNDVNQLQFAVPGLSVEDTGIGRRIEIRGVSNVFGTGGLIGEYIDDAAVSVSPTILGETLDIRTFDLKRVEVLRGPQGTLYGEGSIGGTIRYITNPPDLSAFGIGGNALATFTQGGTPGQLIQTTVNAPVLPGTLGLRAAAEFEHNGGWVNEPTADARGINSSNLTDARFEGLWKLAPDLRISLMQSLYRNAFGPNEGSSTNDTFAQPFGLTLIPRVNSDYSISNGTIRYDMGSTELLSSTTYLHNALDYYDVPTSFQAGPLPAGPIYRSLSPSIAFDESDASEELRLSGVTKGHWRWTVGGFGRRYRDKESPYLYYFAVPGPVSSPLPPEFPFSGEMLRSRSWSAFADTSYRLFNRLTLGAGLRYFRDDQTFMSAGSAQRGNFHSTDPRFYLTYAISDVANLYVNVAKGFRSGGFNSLGFPPYGPESLWSYELGSKMRLMHRALSIDADVYYSDYRNFVSVGFTASSPIDITRNSGTAHIKGVEANIDWRPTSGWLLGLNGDYINARIVSTTLLNPNNAVGDPLDAVPRYQITASVKRQFTLHDKRSYARLDYTQRAPESYRLRSIGPWYYSQSDHIYLLNLALGMQWNEQLGFDVFVKNILNDRAYLDPYAIEGTAGRTRPRNVGLEFSWTLD